MRLVFCCLLFMVLIASVAIGKEYTAADEVFPVQYVDPGTIKIDGYFNDWEKLENVMVIKKGAHSARFFAAYSTSPYHKEQEQLYFGVSVDKEYNLQALTMVADVTLDQIDGAFLPRTLMYTFLSLGENITRASVKDGVVTSKTRWLQHTPRFQLLTSKVLSPNRESLLILRPPMQIEPEYVYFVDHIKGRVYLEWAMSGEYLIDMWLAGAERDRFSVIKPDLKLAFGLSLVNTLKTWIISDNITTYQLISRVRNKHGLFISLLPGIAPKLVGSLGWGHAGFANKDATPLKTLHLIPPPPKFVEQLYLFKGTSEFDGVKLDWSVKQNIPSQVLKVYRTSGGEFTPMHSIQSIELIANQAHTFKDDSVENNKTYVYYLENTNSSGNVEKSRQLSATYIQPLAEFGFNPNQISIPVGRARTIEMTINQAKGLAGFETTFTFQPDLVEIVDIREGTFLRKDGGNAFSLDEIVDLEKGLVTFASSRTTLGGVSGDGVLAELEVKAKKDGVSSINWDRFALSDPEGIAIGAKTLSALSIKGVFSWDVNGNGRTDIFDLVIAGQHFGQEPPDNPRADVTMDGKVDIFDLVEIANHFGDAIDLKGPDGVVLQLAPAIASQLQLTGAQAIHQAVVALYESGLSLDGSLLAAEVLTRVLNSYNGEGQDRIVTNTRLLPNYPNPFNPETWIPMELSQATEVKLFIYDSDGALVKLLDLGYLDAGSYLNKSNAIHWDGKTETGEQVSSGTYFYQIEAGDYTETRKMVILK